MSTLKKMKKMNALVSLSLVFVLVSSWENLQAQTIQIPDTSFEKALIELGIDKNGKKGSIDASDATGITELHISSKGIQNLTGIEAFKDLKFLKCNSNDLKSLDLSNNKFLEHIECDSNQIQGILSLESMSKLEFLSCVGNMITDLSFKQTPYLRYLNCSSNNIQELILNLRYLRYLDCSKNNMIKFVAPRFGELKFLDCSENKISILVTASLKELDTIVCDKNQLVSLDLSCNPKISFLDCGNNSLRYLNVHNGSNTKIDTFNTEGNSDLFSVCVDSVDYANEKFTSIDPWTMFKSDLCATTFIRDSSFEAALINQGLDSTGQTGTILNHQAGKVQKLDLSGAGIIELDGIEAFSNLTYLDVSRNKMDLLLLPQNIHLEELVCHTNIRLQVLDVSSCKELIKLNCSQNRLFYLMLDSNSKLENLNCSYNNLTDLNLSKNVHIDSLNCYENDISQLNLSNNTSLKYLHCGGNNLTNLETSSHKKLEELYCMSNNIKTLDLAQNTSLRTLECYHNSITNLELTGTPILENLFCSNNSLTTLNLSTNTYLRYVDCRENKLGDLNLQNGKNKELVYLNTRENNDLFHICVDDAQYAKEKFFYKDSQAEYLDGACILGSEELNYSSVNIYPNPSQGQFTIQLDRIEATLIQISDMQGRVLKTVYPEHQSTIELASLPPGAYVVSITSEPKVYYHKVIVE